MTNAQSPALLLGLFLLLAAVAAPGASATSPDGCDGQEPEEETQTDAAGEDDPAPGGNGTAQADNTTAGSDSQTCIVVAVAGSSGPCSVTRISDDRPSLTLDPLLGMIEVDPDHCVKRMVQRAVAVGSFYP